VRVSYSPGLAGPGKARQGKARRGRARQGKESPQKCGAYSDIGVRR